MVSHVQWALSLVVDVRRNDSILSWNGQNVLSNSAYAISFVCDGCFVVYSTGFINEMGKSSGMEYVRLELILMTKLTR